MLAADGPVVDDASRLERVRRLRPPATGRRAAHTGSGRRRGPPVRRAGRRHHAAHDPAHAELAASAGVDVPAIEAELAAIAERVSHSAGTEIVIHPPLLAA